eukprot:jgi/Mesvir1/5274/Mv15384-RA.1
MDPSTRRDRDGDLEWVMESLRFTGEFLSGDPPDESSLETESLSRLMHVRGKWDRQISGAVSEFMKASKEPNLERLASHLESLGVYVSVSVTVHIPSIPRYDTEVSTSPFMPNSFLVVRPQGSKEALIIDPLFREKFTIARATEDYKAFLNEAVPPVIVGSRNKIRAIVCIISERMARSFQKMGLEVPPWRRLQAALSMWPVAMPSKPFTVSVKAGTPQLKVAVEPGAAPGAHSPRRLQGFAVTNAYSTSPPSTSLACNAKGQLARAFQAASACARAA